MQPFIPLPDATVELRRAFGRFGTGVTVITVQTPLGPLGMTANSFSSVSLADSFAISGHAFDGLNWSAGPNGAPTLPGCLATFHCETFAIHPAGDHSVILGQVQYAAFHPDENAPALLFEQGRFGVFTASE